MTVPHDHKSASGRFLLRIPPGLHAMLRQAAAERGVSLNEYCARKLSAPLGELAGWREASEAVSRAAGAFGDSLVGVVAFGSWAREELREDSDIDLLVVVDDSVALTRDLYRPWDRTPIRWGAHPVEPHFVHLPAPERTVAGLWAEVAIDGFILFARSRSLPARLARVRRDIASGRIVRRVVHGHPYWVEAA